MKQHLILLLGVILTNICLAQETGIHFEQNLTWEQVQQKAKTQNKYIFIDCYATWCGPCKEMDQKVYPDSTVGDFYNRYFVSAKVQFDSAKNDNEHIKAWYSTAMIFRQKYLIANGGIVLPSFLIFSPDGTFIDMWSGFTAPSDLVKKGNEAIAVSQRVFDLLQKYHSNRLSYDDMPFLISKLSKMQSYKIRDSISDVYIDQYLLKLSKQQLFNLENLNFIANYTSSPEAKGYIFFKENAAEIDKAVGSNTFAEMGLVNIINVHIVQPVTTSRRLSNFEWDSLETSLFKKYGRYGRIAVLQERLAKDWGISYYSTPDWTEYGDIYLRYVRAAGPLVKFDFNNISWDLFEHCDDKKTLASGAKLFEPYKNNSDAGELDTYANLLYKSGSKAEAILWENKAVHLNKANAEKVHQKPDPVYEQTLNKMQRGEKTW